MEIVPDRTHVSDSKIILLCMGRAFFPCVSPIDEGSTDIFLLALSELALYVEIWRIFFMIKGLNLVMTSRWLLEELIFEIFLSNILAESTLVKAIGQCWTKIRLIDNTVMVFFS